MKDAVLVAFDSDIVFVKNRSAIMVTEDADGNEGVWVKFGKDVSLCGTAWQACPIDGSCASGTDEVAIG